MVQSGGAVAARPLLLVPLHHVGWSCRGGVRIETGFAQRASLAEQIPARVERDLELVQAPAIAFPGIPADSRCQSSRSSATSRSIA